MIVGLDPLRTRLSDQERDKIIIKSLKSLFGGAGLSRINEWPDGLKEVCFLADGYCRILHMRDGFVLTDNIERRDYDNSSVIKHCISHSACYEGCGCPCLLGQSYVSDPGTYRKTAGHCKDFTGEEAHWRGDHHGYCLAEMYDSADHDSE